MSKRKEKQKFDIDEFIQEAVRRFKEKKARRRGQLRPPRGVPIVPIMPLMEQKPADTAVMKSSEKKKKPKIIRRKIYI